MGGLPVVQPAGVVLRVDQRTSTIKHGDLVSEGRLHIPATPEVHGREDPGDHAVDEIVGPGPVRGEEDHVLAYLTNNKITEQNHLSRQYQTTDEISEGGQVMDVFVARLQSEGPVLILNLDHCDGASVFEEKRSEYCEQLGEPDGDPLHVILVIGPQLDVLLLQQPWSQPSKVSLGIDKRSWPENDVQPQFLGRGDEGENVSLTREDKVARLRFMRGPLYVGLNSVGSCQSQFLEAISPGARQHSEVVDRAGDVAVRFAIPDESLVCRIY